MTSDEYPLNGATRYDVDGSGVAVPVIAPVTIKSVVASPSSVVYGTGATITIVVQNFWNQPLTGAQLNYDIQTNAFYQAGSATPNPSATPNSAITGGRLSWTFNMPAGSKTTPSEATFTLGVLGTYTNSAQAGTAQVIAPADVPSACIVSRSGRVNLTPRLEVTKAAELDPDVIVDNAFPVQRNQDVAYTITIENTGNADATAVDVTDAIPGASGANFSYVPNSATLNGQAHEPDSISNGRGGSLIWTQLIVPAGRKIVLRYMLNVDGFDYVRYCNNVTAESDDENIIYPRRQVCVKINPQIEIIKTGDRTTTTAGGEVQFTLRLTNREPQAYRVGMYDLLGEFTFVRQISGYAEPEVIANGDALQWPLVDLAPGGILEVTIVATVPNNCQTREYINEGMFYNPTGTRSYDPTGARQSEGDVRRDRVQQSQGPRYREPGRPCGVYAERPQRRCCCRLQHPGGRYSAARFPLRSHGCIERHQDIANANSTGRHHQIDLDYRHTRQHQDKPDQVHRTLRQRRR